jgi:lipopolysaccharide export system protein LptC
MSALARTIVLVAFLATVAHAQMTPDAPIKNFKLPMFNNAGVRIWDLRGEEAKYVSQDRVDLFTMTLKVFDDDGSGEVRIEIQSPQATVFANEHLVTGENNIRMFTDDFEISGRNYTWRGREQSVTIREDVRVVFNTPLQDMLK